MYTANEKSSAGTRLAALSLLAVATAAAPAQPTCADPSTTVFGQQPDITNWTLAFSDVDGAYHNWHTSVWYDNICGIDQQITGVRFWGLNFSYHETGWPPAVWEQCTANPRAFDIRFFADADGRPGPEICSYVATVSGVPVDHVGYLQYDLYQYDVEFASPCVLQRGWVSIAGAGAPDCWFVWMSSTDGDGHSLSDIGTPEEMAWAFDLALCLVTDGQPVYGACCDDRVGCQENVALSECGGRFIAGGLCDDFDPPCGQALGACCYADGTCQDRTYRQCEIPICIGDLNCDGQIDFGDINPFVLYLSSFPSWQANYPGCDPDNGDINQDGTYGAATFGDINPFVQLIWACANGCSCPSPIPPPMTGTWQGPDTDCGRCWPRMIDAPTGLPYADVNTTCGRQSKFDATCLGTFDGGEDIVYELHVTGDPLDLEITLVLDPNDTRYTGLLVSDHFPPDADCIAYSTSAAAAPHSLGCRNYAPGTYYIMVDNWPAPACIPHFALTVNACVPDPELGRCCYEYPLPCAELTQRACEEIGGTWTAGLDCATPCHDLEGEDCSHAIVVPILPYARSLYDDTMTADGPAAACDKYGAPGPMQNDVWFVWTPEVDCLATATVAAVYDAVLVARAGCPDPAELGCADQDQGNVEMVRFSALAGQTYYFQLGQVGNFAGGGWTRFNLDCTTGGGACCFPDGSCYETWGSDCVSQGGDYLGDDTWCWSANCPQPTPGDNCGDPLTLLVSLATLPIVHTATTTARHNDYADTCLGTYDEGQDIVYALLVTETVVVNITLDPHGTPDTGILLADHCPPNGDCIAKSVSTGTQPHGMTYVVLWPGVYYLMIDKRLTPPDVAEFDLHIELCDGDPAACCLESLCVGDITLGECLSVGGTWHRGEQCQFFECPTLPGNTCENPLVFYLPEQLGEELWCDPYLFGNTYAGNTCLAPFDTAREYIVQLVVSSETHIEWIRPMWLGEYDVHMAIAATCPPSEPCLAVSKDWYGVQTIENVTLAPGVYYLMFDTRPIGNPYVGWDDQWSADLFTCCP